MKLKFFKASLLFLIFLTQPPLASGAVRIAQIDPSNLLLNQEVSTWVSVTRHGIPVPNLQKKDFSVFESSIDRKKGFTAVRITGFEKNSNTKNGITLLLLVDNSGSMYRSWNGMPVAHHAWRRIGIASRVINNFLKTITNPKDRVGLAIFNTRFTMLSKPERDRAGIASALSRVKMPQWEESYTELYAALTKAASSLSGTTGRKAVIVLTDGVNDPFSLGEKKPHPEYGQTLYTPEMATKKCNRSGVSIFAINLGTGRMRDKHIGWIALNTGGASFEARSATALATLYQKISTLMAAEYRLTFLATMDPAEIKHVRIAHNKYGTGIRDYYSSTIFGMPEALSPLLLLPLLAALALLLYLGRPRKQPDSSPGLDILDGAGTILFEGNRAGKSIRLANSGTMVFSLGSGQTMVSASPTDTPVESATILFNPAQKTFFLEATRPIRVNNNPVTKRRLQSGDLIEMDGKTFVFDSGKGEA